MTATHRPHCTLYGKVLMTPGIPARRTLMRASVSPLHAHGLSPQGDI